MSAEARRLSTVRVDVPVSLHDRLKACDIEKPGAPPG